MRYFLLICIGLAVPLIAAVTAPPFGQCGGSGYEADCPEEYECEIVNPSESLCLR